MQAAFLIVSFRGRQFYSKNGIFARKWLQIPSRSGIIERKIAARKEICLYYSTNAKNAKRNLKS